MGKVLTQFAEHANTIAETFRAAFAQKRLGDCTIDMTAPTESTQGGRLGLQHLTLRTPEGLAIVLGTVHAGERKAELRAYSVVAALYEERLKRPPPFTSDAYETVFVQRAKPVIAAFGLTVGVSDVLPEAPLRVEDSIPPPASKRTIVSWVVFLVAFVAIALAGGYWARRRH